MSDPLAVLIGAIIAAASGLLGALGGQWLANRSAEIDREIARSAAIATVRRDAYAALLSAAEATISAYRTSLRVSVSSGPGLGPTVDRAVAVVRLVGPTDVALAAAAYAVAMKNGHDPGRAEAHFIETARKYALPPSP